MASRKRTPSPPAVSPLIADADLKPVHPLWKQNQARAIIEESERTCRANFPWWFTGHTPDIWRRIREFLRSIGGDELFRLVLEEEVEPLIPHAPHLTGYDPSDRTRVLGHLAGLRPPFLQRVVLGNGGGFDLFHGWDGLWPDNLRRHGEPAEKVKKWYDSWLPITAKPIDGREAIFQIPAPDPAKHHYFYVRAVNVLGQEGFYTDIVSATDKRFHP